MSNNSLSPTQLDAVMSHVVQTDDALIWLLAVTAMRQDELVNVCFRDFDVLEGVVDIRGSKGSRSRSLSVPAPLMTLISKFIKEQGGVDVVSKWSCMSYMKLRYYKANKRENDRKASKKMLVRKWQGITKELKIHKVTLHGLRHTFGHMSINEASISIKQLQHILGHVRLDSTSIYTPATNKIEDQKTVLAMYGAK